VVTLLALSLVVGILVDDAIVEIENIVRHLRMGKTPYQAAMEAADEIGLAVIATTFTLIAVFLPTAFMSGMPGKFFKQFGWTAALAVFASLVVARMLTPMMAAYLLRRRKPPPAPDRAWMRYELHWAGPRGACAPLADDAGALLFFVGSIIAGAAAAHRLHSAGRPRRPRSPGAAAGQHASSRRWRGRAGARCWCRATRTSSWSTPPSVAAAGSDPFAAGARRGAQGDADHPTPERGERGASKQDDRGRAARGADRLPGVRVKGRPGGSGEKYILVLAGEDGARWRARPGSSATCAPFPASATSPTPPAWCGPNWWCGPTSPAPPTWA
jgi:hypothetical protein